MSLNPFVSQVNSFYEPETNALCLLESQSLRKSGQFFPPKHFDIVRFKNGSQSLRKSGQFFPSMMSAYPDRQSEMSQSLRKSGQFFPN